MNFGFRFWKWGFHCNGTKDELEPLVIPGLWILFTAYQGHLASKALLKKGSQRNKVNADKKKDDSKHPVMAEPVVRKASELTAVGSDLDDHQLAGKLLYREDICLCYGEEHVGKTSILLGMIIDIVFQRKSLFMKDDCGTHPPCH